MVKVFPVADHKKGVFVDHLEKLEESAITRAIDLRYSDDYYGKFVFEREHQLFSSQLGNPVYIFWIAG
jgi:hypothetical protein